MPSLERIITINHHLLLALNQVSDAVIVVEAGPLEAPGPRVVFANEALAEATGVPAHKLCRLPLGALSDGDMLLSMLVALSHSTGGAVEGKAQLKHLSEKPMPCHWSAVAVRDGEGRTLNYIFTATPDLNGTGLTAEPPPPVTDYHIDQVEIIRDTARYVAHEFNNALTGILLPVQVALREVAGGGEIHSKLQVAYESARRAADLAKDFLDCFRPREAVRERCHIGGLLGRAMRLSTCAQNVNWTLEVADELWDAEVDCNQIERVIFNLVRNACQAMPSGGKLLVKACNATVEASAEHDMKPGNYVHISVRDWGPGIPEDHLGHLFSSRFTTKADGNGCGLPICYQIVRDHGGGLYVKSKVQVGTAFLIFLPALAVQAEVEVNLPAPPPAPAAAAPLQATAPVTLPPITGLMQPPLEPAVAAIEPPPPPAPEPLAEDKPTLLVVDDEVAVLSAFRQVGSACGFVVTTAATAEEGLQHFRDRLHGQRPYDTVLLDINLRGGTNGEEALAIMLRHGPEIPVIATSGQSSEEDVERYARLGFAGFLPKPFTLEQFDEVMNEVLAPA